MTFGLTLTGHSRDEEAEAAFLEDVRGVLRRHSARGGTASGTVSTTHHGLVTLATVAAPQPEGNPK